MAALHEALTSLSPTEWSDIPQDNLKPYVEDILKSAELICNSIPPPPNGTPFAESTPVSTEPNTATSHKDMHPSTARQLPPDQEFEELQSQWGKPMKFSSKENPLEIAIYKMAGKDRHGGWFARRSVHEGIGFTKFRDAMAREFAASLAVEGGPGAGCIRGIGADKTLEDHSLDGTGRVEVYQLSAQFPGPTTPREFITLLITSDSALSEKSLASANAIPRHYIIVSRPIKHPDAPERSGYIRGQYESVELIREIPLQQSKTKSTTDLLATAGKDSTADERAAALRRAKSEHPADKEPISTSTDERELNPVEWIMITRSDPGGGIPRFMVDRGTPSAMIGDVHKFLDWAAKGTTPLPAQEDGHSQPIIKEPDAQSLEVSDVTETPATEIKVAPNGIFQNLTSTLEAGLDAYAPTMISSFVHEKFDTRELSDEDSSDISDTDSFASATEKRRSSITGAVPGESSESISLASLNTQSDEKRKLGPHEKKLQDIGKDYEKLERRLAKKKADEEARLKKAQEDEETETTKAQERYDKETKKQEEKHRKELEKLEAKKEREFKKLQQKRQKQLDRDTVYKLTRERDEFRSQVDLLKKENAVLRERIEHFEAKDSST